jgi:hypothetical protein
MMLTRKDAIRCWVTATLVAGLLAGCSAGAPGEDPAEPVASTVTEPAKLDGTYSFELSPQTTLSGKEIPESAAVTLTVALRSVCDPSGQGCVATAALIDPPEEFAGDRIDSMVFDYVDGRWLGVSPALIGCGGPPVAWFERYQIVELQPQPDGTLSGRDYNRMVDDTKCSNRGRTLTAKRVGDIDPAVSVSDPALQPPLVTNRAQNLRGRYRLTATAKSTGKVEDRGEYDVTTWCVRTGAQCLSLLADGAELKRFYTYLFDAGKWTRDVKDQPSKCSDGAVSVRSSHTEFPLPQPADSPIAKLVGSSHLEEGPPCPAAGDFEYVWERVGD